MCIFVYREPAGVEISTYYGLHMLSQSYKYAVIYKNIFVYSMLSKIKVNKIKAGCQHAEGLRKRGEIRHPDGIYVFY